MSLSIIKSNLCLNSSVWKLGDSKQHFGCYSVMDVEKGGNDKLGFIEEALVNKIVFFTLTGIQITKILNLTKTDLCCFSLRNSHSIYKMCLIQLLCMMYDCV